MADTFNFLPPTDPELRMLVNNKTDDYDYRKRRDDDWLENYTLSRDKVIINRLTQRQTVNLPVMKTVLRSLIKDVDDMPVLYFENLDSDKQAEIFKNEYWKIVGDEHHNKFDIFDIGDKRQMFEFGRTYDQLQVVNGMPRFGVIDSRDILVPRYNDPFNIDNNRHLIHSHIFVPLSELLANPEYDQTAVKELAAWYETKNGLVKNATNTDMLTQRNKLETELGILNVDNPIFGETFVELSQHLVYHKGSLDTKERLYVYTEADNMKILRKKPLDEIIGKTKDDYWTNHFPYNSWADDVEKQDWYSDGIADIVRPTAKVVNVWWSQLVENRTMRSFGMNIFNASVEGFQPQTWEPKAWGWYGMPVPDGKNLSDVYQSIQIPDLGDSLQEMEFAIGMIEKATGATTTQQGAQNDRQVTLGEVQLALGEAKQRIKGMSKYYTQVWKERGNKFVKLIEAAPDKLDAVKIYKKGRMTDEIYEREVEPNDWKSNAGYRCKVWSQAERNEENTQSLEKTNAIKANMPDNPVVDGVYKRKLLEFGDFTPDEINDAMKYEDDKKAMLMNVGIDQGAGGVQPNIPAQAAVQPGANQAPVLTGGAVK